MCTRACRLRQRRQPDGYPDYPAVSADGKVVAFISGATNIVSPSTTNAVANVFVAVPR